MTIFALSTGPGISGLAVIRISGSGCKTILQKMVSGKMPKPRIATLRRINKINTSQLIDEGLILWFPGPKSYTGEDILEMHVHGSIAVIKAIQDSLSKVEECRIAEPGEFTKLAFLNGKINLLKAESIGDLIASETDIQRHQALDIMSGQHGMKYEKWRSQLLKILSNVEAKIDFPEDDLPNDILGNIKASSHEIKIQIQKVLDDKRVGERIREGFKIAILGPANAGKSSLLNYLSKRDVAIVSEIAGTTRDVIETHLNLDGYPVILSDTAGIRDAKDEIERKGVKLALKKAENADLNIVVIEPKSGYFTGVLKGLVNSDRTILVVNKSDLGTQNIEKELSIFKPIYISIKKEINLDKLILVIRDKLKNKFISTEDTIITRERHRQHLSQCVEHLENFENKNSEGDFDKAAEDLRLATRHLGMIVGKVDVEEILGSIFNDFCIGK
ncbi:MAG: tRNA uridine-5-carboxymethylaminomethyl(34) synthesis GTPase MnmE [Candidatus Pelagibacter sp.]|nr:tRNA uridine-5-carboxymethylaminomethyl(34) synthesis GTPase MnmE [Candidatus Pelagibacter sp.]|tara:strand:- start:2412 stop:3746 length:1335 start_codon:yes stop_codon:yes gene_type:complete